MVCSDNLLFISYFYPSQWFNVFIYFYLFYFILFVVFVFYIFYLLCLFITTHSHRVQDDWTHYAEFTKAIGKDVQVVGDDLLVTNVTRIQEAVGKKACNALLLKVLT